MPAGACLLVLGPSGSGKSTFGLALAGLVPRDIPAEMTGSLTVDGMETRAYDPAALAARVGMVFQDPGSQLVMERVEDEVAFGLENRGWEPARMRARVPEALAAVGLVGLERRRSHRLSGGQQQRLALAGVLAPMPGCLVLDEPTANLDPEGSVALFDRLRAVRAARGTTLVLIEHHVDLAWPLADLVIALDRDGSLIDAGDPDAVLARSGARIRAAGSWLPGERRSRTGAPTTSGPTSPILVEARGVAFSYEPGVPVLDAVDLAIGAGERLALVGGNGSGKSTLGRLLVGLLRPTRGRVRLGDEDPARLSAATLARRAGYVFQDPESGFLTSRVEDEVLLGLRPDERRGAADLMERLGLPLERFADRDPYRLRRGESRRVSLACTLVRAPELLVLDEPTYGQDRHNHESLVEMLGEQVAAGAALVAATHDEHFVATVADRIVRVTHGRLGPGS